VVCSLLLAFCIGVALAQEVQTCAGEESCASSLVEKATWLAFFGGEEQEALVADHERNGRSKLVHFVRHAEGHHNVAASNYERGSHEYLLTLTDYQWYDAELSPKGLEQCEQLERDAQHLDYDIVLVSPLTRALQTATLGLRFERNVPFVALEDLRERYGRNPCDNRRPVSELQPKFRSVDFSLVADTDKNRCTCCICVFSVCDALPSLCLDALGTRVVDGVRDACRHHILTAGSRCHVHACFFLCTFCSLRGLWRPGDL
jgi:hypothetical protein